jgi:hypothetical protein
MVGLIGWFIVLNAAFNNISVISWRSVLLVEETRVPGENHRPVANHRQTLSHNVVSSTPTMSGIRTHTFMVIGTYMYYSTETCQSWYHIYEYFPYSINWYNKIILELINIQKSSVHRNLFVEALPHNVTWGRHDRMVVGFTTFCGIIHVIKFHY